MFQRTAQYTGYITNSGFIFSVVNVPSETLLNYLIDLVGLVSVLRRFTQVSGVHECLVITVYTCVSTLPDVRPALGHVASL